jgi:hypothetical protein
MKKLILSIAFCTISMIAMGSGTFRYEGFSGGMMLHTGYVQSHGYYPIAEGAALDFVRPKGAPFGIGGAVKVHLGQHFRVGSEGYVSTLKHGVKGSYCSLGWGGLLMDSHWNIGNFTTFVGGTVGGGRYKNLTLQQPYGFDYEVEPNTSFRSYSVMVLTPFVGFEYAAKCNFHISLKLDYIVNLNHREADFVEGVRIYLGVMFYHLRTHKN